MLAGDTFFKEDENGMRHLYVVVSDPTISEDVRFPGYVFLVMFSTREKHKEDACVLVEGDHPFISHDTVVMYNTPPAIFEPLTIINEQVDKGVFKSGKPVSSELLAKIRNGYSKTRYQKDKIFHFLFRQGVVE